MEDYGAVRWWRKKKRGPFGVGRDMHIVGLMEIFNKPIGMIKSCKSNAFLLILQSFIILRSFGIVTRHQWPSSGLNCLDQRHELEMH